MTKQFLTVNIPTQVHRRRKKKTKENIKHTKRREERTPQTTEAFKVFHMQIWNTEQKKYFLHIKVCYLNGVL